MSKGWKEIDIMVDQYNFTNLNFTDLRNILPHDQFVYVYGTNIIILMLIIIAFCNVFHLLMTVYRLFIEGGMYK